MILAHTPLRISFVGGGTDIPILSKIWRRVISTAINKFISVRITEGRKSQIAIKHHTTVKRRLLSIKFRIPDSRSVRKTRCNW